MLSLYFGDVKATPDLGANFQCDNGFSRCRELPVVLPAS